MKVGTDGVLLGAWTSCDGRSNILDIGTGTGLVALMLAQRSLANITAIEIDEQASLQAAENIAESPWNKRIKVVHESLQEYCYNSIEKFDLIVCNPPFFKNSLKSASQDRNLARHADQLDFSDLLKYSCSVLQPDGLLCVIVPFERFEELREIAAVAGLYCTKKTIISPCPWKKPHRILAEFCMSILDCETNAFSIELDERHTYSDEYKELTKDFYL